MQLTTPTRKCRFQCSADSLVLRNRQLRQAAIVIRHRKQKSNHNFVVEKIDNYFSDF